MRSPHIHWVRARGETPYVCALLMHQISRMVDHTFQCPWGQWLKCILGGALPHFAEQLRHIIVERHDVSTFRMMLADVIPLLLSS